MRRAGKHDCFDIIAAFTIHYVQNRVICVIIGICGYDQIVVCQGDTLRRHVAADPGSAGRCFDCGGRNHPRDDIDRCTVHVQRVIKFRILLPQLRKQFFFGIDFVDVGTAADKARRGVSAQNVLRCVKPQQCANERCVDH